MINNYGKASVFSSFLPGISGLKGIPIWCFYVNRGQGVVSFGVEDKDHAIMEFYPAHQAYQNVKRTGFRTFMKINGTYYEPFQEDDIQSTMKILMNGLMLEETNNEKQIQTKVEYYTLPTEKVGALVRKVTIKNLSEQNKRLEVLDGIPACIPYGVDLLSMKTMGQTIKAWMQVEDVEKNIPYYCVRISTGDTASVSKLEGGNFSFACLADGTRLNALVDPELVFSYDTSLGKAVGFAACDLEELFSKKQVTQNNLPCSFYGHQQTLSSQEELEFYQVIGQVGSKDILSDFMSERKDQSYFEAKRAEANELVSNLCDGIKTSTASPAFDAYCQYTYMDNVLRGGYPVQIGNNKIFYVYSRKHGDLERDYNYFSTLAQYYSQGNGNFRDVNQNRRCDNFFFPYVKDENIKTFYNLIQMDGYNPLVIEKVSYSLEEGKASQLLSSLPQAARESISKVLDKPFTPGILAMKLEEYIALESEEGRLVFDEVMNQAERLVNASFGEGYWSDHWTYNLDLIEDYLSIYPEDEKTLLLAKEYTYFQTQKNVNIRKKRYVKTTNGIRQYHSLDEEETVLPKEKLVRSQYGKGEVITSTLLEKLILLCTVKFATLDAYGMGTEMEGGKPGWYDALNGLPGIFGSSMAETYELERTLRYTMNAIENHVSELALLKELAELIETLQVCVDHEWENINKEMELLSLWNCMNDAKESYRAKIYTGISGDRKVLTKAFLLKVLNQWHKTVLIGIRKACTFEEGICPTYFAYEVTSYEENADGIIPKHFEVRKMPLFLEGPVRYLKLEVSEKDKMNLYHNIKNSDLFDQKLKMYKVNASLESASFEIGRAKAFTPGWLENESIWLHMEYKYLLELLKSGLYQEFFDDFKRCAIPFQDPAIYGRSIYESSSFIASSKNPNEKFHGKGFVARLSGSTVEFIHMWKLMMFGNAPFSYTGSVLKLQFKPALPDYLVGEMDEIKTRFLTNIEVSYRLNGRKQLIPGEYLIKTMECEDKNGSLYTVAGDCISGDLAIKIRNGEINRIVVEFE